MNNLVAVRRSASRPRVLLAGQYKGAFGTDRDGLAVALAGIVHVERAPVASAMQQSFALFRLAAEAIEYRGCEAIHLLDARLALTGLLLQHRYSVPVTVSVSSLDLSPRWAWDHLSMRAIAHLDHAFVFDREIARALQKRAPALAISVVRPVAEPLPIPRTRDMARVRRSLRGIRRGRLVIAVAWSEGNDLRRFTHRVLPRLEARPACVLIGVPNGRGLSEYTPRGVSRGSVLALRGPVNGGLLAALSRQVDVMALPPACMRTPGASELALAMATSGTLVVAPDSEAARVLIHERTGFVVDAGDDDAWVRTLNQVLALPPVQRHFLGVEFARHALNQWSWTDAAETFADRFSALVGRPRIPAELRAA